MDRDKGKVNEQQLEGFLQDLLFETTSDEEFSLITEMLLDLQDGALIRNERAASRFEILKMSASGAVSVGTIKGIKSAPKSVAMPAIDRKRLLPDLREKNRLADPFG